MFQGNNKNKRQADKPHKPQKGIDTMTTITNISALNTAIETLTAIEGMEEVVTKLTNIKSTYEHRALSAKMGLRKPSKAELAKKEENAKFAEQVFEVIASTPATAKDLAEQFAVTPQKMTSALVALRKAGRVKDVEQEKKSYPHIWQVVGE